MSFGIKNIGIATLVIFAIGLMFVGWLVKIVAPAEMYSMVSKILVGLFVLAALMWGVQKVVKFD